MPFTLRRGLRPETIAVAALYAAAPLRRPIHDLARLAKMIDGANVLVSAWDGERLVGFLRGITDGVWDGVVCDLAVHPSYQAQGVGRALLDDVAREYPEVQWMLLAAPRAKDYYAKVGYTKTDVAWVHARQGWSPGSYEEFEREHEELAKRA